MAGRFGIWARNTAQRWALGLMLMASAGALLATSDPDQHAIYSFETSSDGPRATLLSSKPQVRYLVRARVIALGPDRVDTTASALATVHGSLGSRGSSLDAADAAADASAGGASPFVHVRFGASGQASDEISAQTSFQLARPLRFTGNCAEPTQGSPCQAEVELDFELERPSALPADESVSSDWSVAFESRIFKPESGGNDVSLAAPWTVEIVELVEP